MSTNRSVTRRTNRNESQQHKEDTEMVHPAKTDGQSAQTTTVEAKSSTGRGIVSNFSQQKLRAWQPVLTPKWIISVFLAFGAIFIGLGVVLLITSNNVIQCTVSYGDPPVACSNITSCTTEVVRTIDVDNCLGPNPQKINPPIYVYYELTNYFQNHRRYVKSRNDEQLRGKVFTHASDVSSCDPIITGPGDRVYHPCGLIAWSVFNDTFSFSKDGKTIPFNDDAYVIAWSTDIQHKFKNPNPNDVDTQKVYLWLNKEIFPKQIEDGHFIVWMRNAALPDFRKLYAKIEQSIELPINVTIFNRYPVYPFGGTKSVVLSTTSWLGGRNNFLGVAYLVIGAWCLIFGIFFLFHKYKNPRILGDVRYLNWVGNRRPV